MPGRKMPRVERATVVHSDFSPHAAVKRWCVLAAVVIVAGVMARVETQAQTAGATPRLDGSAVDAGDPVPERQRDLRH